MSVRLRLLLLAAVSILAVLAVGLTGWLGSARLGDAGGRIGETAGRSFRQAETLDALFQARGAFDAACEEYQKCIVFAFMGESSEKLRKSVEERLDAVAASPALGAAEKESFSRLRTLFAGGLEWLAKGDSYEASTHAVKTLAEPVSAFRATLSGRVSAAKQAVETDRKGAERESRQALGTGTRVREILAGSIGIALLLTLALSAWTIRFVNRRLRPLLAMAGELSLGRFDTRLPTEGRDEFGMLSASSNRIAESLQARAEVAQAVAHGDLTRQIEPLSPHDRLGAALRDMLAALQRLGEVTVAAEAVAQASREIREASGGLSDNATRQAASLEEITATTGEIGGRARRNAAAAAEASVLAGKTRDAAADGRREVAALAAVMTEVRDSGARISKIVRTIDDIAFQTNLLALNAAVEAARAGRHGKGFAVVAEEVRRLAGRSAEASRETGELIRSTVEQVEAAHRSAAGADATLGRILDEVTKSATVVDTIAAASEEQARGVSETEQGLRQLDETTQRNTAGAEETAAAAEELLRRAEALSALMATFRLHREPGGQLPVPAP